MKLTKNIKILIFLVISTILIEFSSSIKNTEMESNESKESINLNGGSFVFKHKKIRTSSQNSNKKSTALNESKEKNKFAEASSIKSSNSKVSIKSNHQPVTSDLMGANPDLLKQTNLLAVGYEANKAKMPGFDKKLDFDKMGPIAFHSWIKFFKYRDQIASDKNTKLKFNQRRKFLDNGEFREQLKYYPGENYQEKDKDGEFKYVSDGQSFYLVAFKNQVVIFSSKMVNKNIFKNKTKNKK